MHILVVEDDNRVARALQAALAREGYQVTRVATVQDALAATPADLVLLDLNLPDGDGMTVCRELRRRGSTAVIMVTARAEEAHRVRGLRAGADDYVVKPFGVAELMARIEAVARRTRADRARAGRLGRLELGGPDGLEIDLDDRRVRAAGQPVELTRKEFDLLALLAADPGAVRSRSQIVDQVWQARYETSSRTLDVHVAALRAKLGGCTAIRIETIRGVGYRLQADG